jgi:hypothetical protein
VSIGSGHGMLQYGSNEEKEKKKKEIRKQENKNTRK